MEKTPAWRSEEICLVQLGHLPTAQQSHSSLPPVMSPGCLSGCALGAGEDHK